MSKLGSFVWGIADQLRGVYKPHQYGDVILPFTILRRLDCVLESSHDKVQEIIKSTPEGDLRDAKVRQATGLTFYNSSPWTFARLVQDTDHLAANLVDFIAGFSKNIDVFEAFKFENEIQTLNKNNRLLIVAQDFAKLDLHPNVVSNAEMGDLFEDLIRRFAEASNETAGEHFTPRDAIRLLVDLVFAGDDSALTDDGVVRTVYDPTVGTGGMLTVAEDHLKAMNPGAELALFGQELNEQTYAICKSDMVAKGQDASNIRLGDTLADDQFAGRHFDFVLANPPYGVDWKASKEAVEKHIAEMGERSRFPGGVPPISDGQMLFLQHIVTKLRPASQNGGRAGVVLNGSPLFTGAAGSGPSEIRRWLLENDYLDAVVALPTNMFFNTGIATYIWLLDTDKPAARRGTVQLIDGSNFFTKMRKNLGSKSRELSDADRKTIVELYDAHAESEQSKIFSTDAFGYWTITVERPLRDEAGEIVRDKKGNPKPDSKLRDTENVPFTYGGNTAGASAAADVIKSYFEAEVLPHVPDAWVDSAKTKVGYEIPFTRHFYKYVPPRPLEEIDAELNTLVGEIMTLLKEIEQ